MPRSKPWLKMWVEWIADPKMDSLALSEQGAWWRLVSLAHQCAHDGALTAGGSPLSLDEIMKTLKITDEGDKRDFSRMVEKMKSRGSLHLDLNTLIVTHYKGRQEMNPSTTKEAVAQRKREERYRKWLLEHPEESMSQENRDNEPDTDPPSPQDVEKDIEKDAEGEEEGKFVTLSRKTRDYSGEHPSPSPVAIALLDNFPKAFGRKPDSREKAYLCDIEKEISAAGATPEQVYDAYKEAAKYNKLHLSYVREVLYTWLDIERKSVIK